MSTFDESAFLGKLDEALLIVRKVLEANRNPTHPQSVAHKYDDKYLLAEFLTNTSTAAFMNVLEALGASEEHVVQMKKWSEQKRVYLRFNESRSCTHVREEERWEEGKTTRETTFSGVGTFTRGTRHKVVEHFFDFRFKFTLLASSGSNQIVIMERSSRVEIMGHSRSCPVSSTSSTYEVDLTWLLQNITGGLHMGFAIDREKKQCHTPRRNPAVESALSFFGDLGRFGQNVGSFFVRTLFPIEERKKQKPAHDLSALEASKVFVPVLALFEDRRDGDGVLMGVGDLNLFLEHQKATLHEVYAALATTFPGEEIASAVEARLAVTMQHVDLLASAYREGIEYIEHMLYEQLKAAIRKEVTAEDFTEYMVFHGRRLLKPAYAPQPFSYAVRRGGRDPEGEVQVVVDGGKQRPVNATVRSFAAEECLPLEFQLNAGTSVAMRGARYVHGFMGHEFDSQGRQRLNLSVRARQFSCFLVMAGRMVGANKFEPFASIIVQNRDRLLIPLLVEHIPSAKEFAAAVSSLSPEQRRFAEAIRNYQLSATLFGVCVVHIKPQLERVLGLPEGALVKHVKLTQDAMRLFTEYNIPSDLLSFTGDSTTPVEQQVAFVREQVSVMVEMLDKAKAEQLRQKQQEREMFRSQHSIRMYVKSLTGKLINAELCDTDRVWDLKLIVQDKDGIPCDQQRMVFMGRQLENERSLASYGITQNSTVHLILRLRGGGGEPAPRSEEPPAPPPDPATAEGGAEALTTSVVVDYDVCKLPFALEHTYATLDEDGAIHAAILRLDRQWHKWFYRSVLSDESSQVMETADQVHERNRAYDLLDALSKSGVLEMAQADLHVLVAATHSFHRALVHTVIQENVNPIEHVERSWLMMAATIHEQEVEEMLREEQVDRVRTYSPKLFPPA